MLELKPYKNIYAEKVLSWLVDERQFYRWSAGKMGGYPITPERLNTFYENLCASQKVYIMLAFDEGEPIGQFVIRHPFFDDREMRLGFIIVDSEKRGKGYGKKMLREAIKYGFSVLKAEKISLGVFEENAPAIGCYEKVGLKLNGKSEYYKILGEDWNCLDMEIHGKDTPYYTERTMDEVDMETNEDVLDNGKDVSVDTNEENIFEEIEKELNHEKMVTSRLKQEKKKQEKKKSALKEFLSWVWMALVAIIAALIINNFIIVNATVPTGSMENTIKTGSRMIGLRFAYMLSEPERGDVVVFDFPLYKEYGYKEPVNYVKRIIGLPGEVVIIENAKVFIYKDGDTTKEPIVLEENYLKEEWIYMTGNYEFKVPENCYLMLGDNRNNSADARTWYKDVNFYNSNNPDNQMDANIIYIHEDDILGKAVCTYWPLKEIGLIK